MPALVGSVRGFQFGHPCCSNDQHVRISMFEVIDFNVLMNIFRSYVVVTSDVLVPGSELLIDLHLLGLTKSDSKEDNEPDECVLDLSVSADDHLWHRSVWKIELDKTPKSKLFYDFYPKFCHSMKF